MLEDVANTVVRKILDSDAPVSEKADYLLATMVQHFVLAVTESIDSVHKNLVREVEALIEDGTFVGPVQDLLLDVKDLTNRRIQRDLLGGTT